MNTDCSNGKADSYHCQCPKEENQEMGDGICSIEYFDSFTCPGTILRLFWFGTRLIIDKEGRLSVVAYIGSGHSSRKGSAFDGELRKLLRTMGIRMNEQKLLYVVQDGEIRDNWQMHRVLAS